MGADDAKVKDSVQAVIEMSSPRTIKSHLRPELLPKDLWTKKQKVLGYSFIRACSRYVNDNKVISYDSVGNTMRV